MGGLSRVAGDWTVAVCESRRGCSDNQEVGWQTMTSLLLPWQHVDISDVSDPSFAPNANSGTLYVFHKTLYFFNMFDVHILLQ